MLEAAGIPAATAAAVWADVKDFKMLRQTGPRNFEEVPEAEREAPVALKQA